MSDWTPPIITCDECGTKRELTGNGRIEPAEKRGYVHVFGDCPKCERKTWSKPWHMRVMSQADIEKALKNPPTR